MYILFFVYIICNYFPVYNYASNSAFSEKTLLVKAPSANFDVKCTPNGSKKISIINVSSNKVLQLSTPLWVIICYNRCTSKANSSILSSLPRKSAVQLLVSNYCGILEQSMGARNRVGIGLSYRAVGYIGWRNRFLGSLKVLKCHLW
jgi:hypothetical protein